MVLTAVQITNFFTQPTQIGVPAATMDRLQQEGIASPVDLKDFDDEALKIVKENLQHPAGRVADPNPNANGATIPTPAFVFSARSQTCLAATAKCVRFYDMIDCPIDHLNIHWMPVVKNFDIQWKALVDRKKSDEPDIPKISQTLPVLKWTEAFSDYLHRVIESRMIPLAYAIREHANPPGTAPPRANSQSHSEEHGSVEMDMIMRASHDHALFREDNAKDYFKLEEATHSTMYAASIKPYQRSKNGRGAWIALASQYAGQDKFEAEIKSAEDVLHNRTWNSNGTFTLERFIGLHRVAYVNLQAAAVKVTYQLPTEYTRVGYLLKPLEKTSDPGLQAAIACVKNDAETEEGKRYKFEAAATFLLPNCPVVRRRDTKKRVSGEISEVNVEEMPQAEVAAFGNKPSIGKTGVHL